MILGVDVSSYQPTIDWPTVAKCGRAFAVVKATEGQGYINPQFTSQWDGAAAAGLAVGAYHFVAWTDPILEADYFYDHVSSYLQKGSYLAVDVERGAYPVPSNANAWLDQFLGQLESIAGFEPLLYSSPSFLAENDIRQGSNGLWLANWTWEPPTAPAPWPFWAIWQNAASQAIPGIATPCDSDVFNGTIEQLKLYGLR